MTCLMKDTYYKLKNFLFHPFNVLRIKTLKRTEYVDRDTVLLHASFQVLVDYVEQELFSMNETDNIDDLEMIFESWEEELIQYNSEEQIHYNKETIFLYRWWKKYPIKKVKVWDITEDAIFPLEENQMLIRLINIRKSLWT